MNDRVASAVRIAGSLLELVLPLAGSLLVIGAVVEIWSARWSYPYDLEWMEGGMLAHSWRILQGKGLYVEPNAHFVPYIYPPGYPALLAALSRFAELGPPLGRSVSIAGSLAAAAAVAFVVARHAGALPRDPDATPARPARLPALVASAVFLGTYPGGGAFFDLVRPDGLMLGLLTWAIALGLERSRRATITAAVLLFLAFVTKHNAAVFGLPIVLGIWLRDGAARAALFTAVAALPASLFVLWLQHTSDGRFLVYLLQVPASHPYVFERIWRWTPRELGTPLPVVAVALTALPMWLALLRQRAIPSPVAAFLPVLVGMAAAGIGTYVPPPRDTGLLNAPSSLAFFGLGAGPVALAVFLVGRWRDGGALRGQLGWRGTYGVGVALTAFLLALVMRAHNGGYLNVHIPWFWTLCVAFGLLLAWAPAWFGSPAARTAVTVGAAAQLAWALARLDRGALVPDAEDVAAGDRFVAAAKSVDGEVLSPFAAWLPTYAGKPPSLHYMGVWDLEYPGGPYVDDRGEIFAAVRERRWDLVFAGNQPFPYALPSAYDTVQTPVEPNSRAFMPKTGWNARPERILEPKAP